MVFNTKVLILGQPFNDFSGGGITLTNLFKGWSSENIAVIAYPFMLHNASTNICKNYYQIGAEELKWKFPFSLIKRPFPSGRTDIGSHNVLSTLSEGKNFRNIISSDLLSPVVKWLGLVHCNSTIHLSQKLKGWLSDFGPEVIYLQISNRESVNFAKELISYLGIPSMIHMMDDWPLTISSQGLFKKFWHKTIDSEFRALLNKTSLHLSISDAMSEEYFTRYGKYFIPFHNPVDISAFHTLEEIKKPLRDKLKILYVGRLGTANILSVLFFAKAVGGNLLKTIDIEFDIYTKDYIDPKLRVLRKLRNVEIFPPVNHDFIPSLFRQYDLLLLPLDFTSAGLRFARFSIPTKASEYMLSGIPILVFAPGETAVSKFFSQNHCGLCVTEENTQKIKQALERILIDREYVHTLSLNAASIARTRFDSEKVRIEFQNTITKVVNSSSRNSVRNG